MINNFYNRVELKRAKFQGRAPKLQKPKDDIRWQISAGDYTANFRTKKEALAFKNALAKSYQNPMARLIQHEYYTTPTGSRYMEARER